MPALPDGTVTFLFTDIQGSTRLWEHYPDAMRAALQWHDTLLRQTIETCGGYIFKTVGDGVCAVFANASGAVRAARQAQGAFLNAPKQKFGVLRVRIALLTGEAERRDNDYFGNAVNRTARLCAIAHGGQVILSQATADLLRSEDTDTLGDAVLIDLGLHRLKDLRDAEQVYQLASPELPAGFPDLHSLDRFLHNLPYQLTTLVGREEAVAEAYQLLTGRALKKGPTTANRDMDAVTATPIQTQSPKPKTQSQRVRLLTLTGMGGCGKTRLALQVAAEALEAYPDGVWFVELAPVTDASLLPQTIAHALRADVEQAGRSVRDTLIDTLKQKSTLLVLDNCEHVIDAAAQIAEEVLRACPNVHILATSRESLGIRGETSYRVAPLAVPTASTDFAIESLLRYEAVRLFVERAQAANRNWNFTPQNAAHVCGICRRLDGIPLALELAARRVKGMTAEAIAGQLAERFIRWTGSRTDPPRQQTLEAAIDWSYVLLSPEERVLLSRLSVFVGGFTMDAAQTVCATEETDAETETRESDFLLSPYDVPDHLLRLVDKSLVVFEETEEGDGRYRLLETIRQYGLQRLSQEDTECVRQGHVAWCLSLAEQAEPQLQGPQQARWLDRLEREHDNLRAALQWCLHEETRLKLASALWRFWYIRGYYSEGRGWLEGALMRERNTTPSVRANALNAVGILAMTQGDCEAAQRFYEESLSLYRLLEDRAGEAKALNNLGLVAHRLGDYTTMRERLEQCLPIYLELHEDALAAKVLNNLALVTLSRDEYEAAHTFLSDSLRLYEKQGDKSGAAHALHNLGGVAQMRSDYQTADAYFKQSLVIRANLENQHGISLSLLCLGESARCQGHNEHAVVFFAASQALRETVCAPLSPHDQLEYDNNIQIMRQRISAEAFARCWQRGKSMDTNQMLAFALQNSETHYTP